MWQVLNCTLSVRKLRELASYNLLALHMESTTEQVDDCSVNDQQYGTSDGPGSGEADDHKSGSGSSCAATQSLFNKLRAPRQSDLTWKRKVRQNPSCVPTWLKKPSCSTNPKTVSPSNRARAFGEEQIYVSAGKLFSGTCREEPSPKLSIIKNRVVR